MFKNCIKLSYISIGLVLREIWMRSQTDTPPPPLTHTHTHTHTNAFKKLNLIRVKIILSINTVEETMQTLPLKVKPKVKSYVCRCLFFMVYMKCYTNIRKFIPNSKPYRFSLQPVKWRVDVKILQILKLKESISKDNSEHIR